MVPNTAQYKRSILKSKRGGMHHLRELRTWRPMMFFKKIANEWGWLATSCLMNYTNQAPEFTEQCNLPPHYIYQSHLLSLTDTLNAAAIIPGLMLVARDLDATVCCLCSFSTSRYLSVFSTWYADVACCVAYNGQS